MALVLLAVVVAMRRKVTRRSSWLLRVHAQRAEPAGFRVSSVVG
jgi:hypothetical protein